MAEVVWTEPALAGLDTIADYIALDVPKAASLLVQRIFKHFDQLATHPRSGLKLSELKGWRHRRIVEPACRVNYRQDKKCGYILHVVRSERLLGHSTLAVCAMGAKK